MKTLTLLFTLLVFAASSQTIRIADNNANAPTGPNIYATVQAAHDAAVAGDIVFVQPSASNYGGVTINKPITLRGIGFNTGKDLPLTSSLTNIVLTNRSDNLTNASGTTIEGLAFETIFLGPTTGSFSYTLQNITISNCTMNYIWRLRANENYVPITGLTVKDCLIGVLSFAGGSTSNLLIHRNTFLTGISHGQTANVSGGSNPCNCFLSGTGTVTSVIISNNVFRTGAYINMQNGNTSLAINNNVFLGLPASSHSAFQYQYNANISNNIFYGSAPISSNPFNVANFLEGNTFSNNLSFGTVNNALPPVGSGIGNTGANNIINQDPLFVNAPYNTTYAGTMDFNLQSSSPAKNAGSDGTDIGITGGAYPVTAGNILLKPSSAPVIMQFNPAAMVPQNQPVKSNIKAKAN